MPSFERYNDDYCRGDQTHVLPTAAERAARVEVALFVTCLTDTLYPRVGEAVVRVLRHFGCQVTFPADQTCCGQPAYNSGFHAEAAALARRMIPIFQPYEHVVTPSASCAVMVQRHFPELVSDDEALSQAADELGQKTREFTSFLQGTLNVDIASHLRFDEPVTFHYPCHAREIYRPSDLSRLLSSSPGADVRDPQQIDLCCGFGGMFAVDFPQVSGAMMNDRLDDLSATGARLVVCNEGGCSLNLAGGAHRRDLPLRFKHVAECLAESLGLMEPVS